MRVRHRSMIIMFSQGLTQATAIIITIVLVRIISKEMLGTYRQVFLVFASLAGVFSLQLGNSLYYFIPKLGPERRRGIVAQSIIGTLLMASIISAVMFFGAEPIARTMNNPALASLLRIFALCPFLYQLVELIPAFMISLDRPLRAGMYSLFSSVSAGGASVIAFAQGAELSTVMWLLVSINGICAVVGCIDMARLSTQGSWKVSRALILEQLGYCWPLLAAGVVGTLNFQFGKLLISTFFDPDVYAVYSCGAIEIPVVALLAMSMGAAMMPNLVMRFREGNTWAAVNLWQEGARKAGWVILPCFGLLIFVCPDLILLLYGEEYALAAWPFGVYLVGLPLRVAVYATLFRAAGNTRPIAIGMFIALVSNVVLSTGLVLAGRQTLLSFVAPSIGTVGATFCAVAYLLWRLSDTLQVPLSRLMRWRELGLVLLVSVGCGLFVFVLPLSVLPLMFRLALRSIVFGVLFVGVVLWGRMLQEDELAMLRGVKQRVRQFVLARCGEESHP